MSSLFIPMSAYATFSIVACDQNTGRCGVAVATHNLAVGHGVPFAQAEVGAGVSQFETNPIHARVILEALRNGAAAEKALNLALKRDHEFPDGNSESFRQIGIVSFNGSSAAYTGDEANSFSGQRTDYLVTVQGNGLASEAVLTAMLDCFHETNGALEERLLKALEAGFAQGGQSIGVTSAALLVSTPEGWPMDTDLRVDFAMWSAITDLRKSYDTNVARQLVFRGRRLVQAKNKAQATKHIEEALKRAPDWDRIWLQAARLAEEMGDEQNAQLRFCRFQKLNPVWATKLSDEIDFSACELIKSD